jgi:hypothetical protein
VSASIATWVALLISATAWGEPPAVRAVKQKPYHCGVACAETILRAYGERGAWTKQENLALALCARMPLYKSRGPGPADALEAYYPRFLETYQSQLAELLIDHGCRVINTRASVKKDSGGIRPPVWDLLRDHLAQGHMAVIHVPEHYLAATGVDLDKKVFYFVDPWQPRETFEASFETIASGKPFSTKRNGEARPGWDGRALIFWMDKTVNQRDQCPACDQITEGASYSFCRQCRCLIDRREHHRAERAIDAIARCTKEHEVTNLNASTVRSRLRRLVKNGTCQEADIRASLLHYPVMGDDPDRLETLHRYAERQNLSMDQLSNEDLLEIVTAGESWEETLRERLPEGR